MKRMATILIAVLAICALASLVYAAPLQGPLNPVPGYTGGFPLWVQDNNDLQLDLPQPPLGVAAAVGAVINPPTMTFDPPLTDTLDPQYAYSQALGFGTEAMYWDANASMDIGGTKKGALLVLAVEAAFLPDTGPGNEFIFSRIRIRIDAPVAGDYTVIHPYGTKEFRNVPAGIRTINDTQDIGGAPAGAGCPNPLFTSPDSILSKGVLHADTVVVQPTTGDPTLSPYTDPTQWIGDGVTLTTVSGGTNPDPRAYDANGKPVFRVIGPGVNVSTNLFVVSGHIFSPGKPLPPPPVPPTPVSILRSTFSHTNKATWVDVMAASNPALSPTLTLDLGATLGTFPQGTVGQPTTDGKGNYFFHVSFPSKTILPATVSVTAAATLTGPFVSIPAPKTVSAPLTDFVQISAASYSVGGKSLSVGAASSDAVNPPVLTALGYGPLTGRAGKATTFTGVNFPPVSLSVTSAEGGSDTAAVDILP